MATLDLDGFIIKSEDRPAIWDVRCCNDYNNKIVKAKSWEEMCDIFVSGFREMDFAGKPNQTRILTVVQVFGTEPPYHNEWFFRCCGVAGFVKDNSRRSFYIQVYNMASEEVVFEQEIYRNFVYHSGSAFFHQFESENTIIGLNFADENEAHTFKIIIDGFLERKKKKEVTKEIESPNARTQDLATARRRRHSKKGRRRLSKSDIGHPENFVHIQHVGLTSKGFQTPTTLNEESLLSFIIDMSDIKPAELEKPGARESVMSYIQKKGGVNKVYNKIQEIKKFTRHPSPNRTLSHFQNPPKEESRTKTITQISAPIHPAEKQHEMIPSQRPSVPSGPKPKCLSRSISTPAPTPPPPPPPPPSQPIHLTPTSSPLATRKPTCSVTDPAGHSPSITDTGSSRSNFLNEIRNPTIKLKHVESVEDESVGGSPLCGSGSPIINFLARALEDRGRACRGDSDYESSTDSNSSETDSDDDW